MTWIDCLKKISTGVAVGPVRMGDVMMATMDKCIENELRTEAMLLERDVNGGECQRCGKPYTRVDVKTKYIEFRYFQPACNCYPRCPWCGRILHHEAETGRKHCEHCPPSRCSEYSTKTEWSQDDKRKVEKKVRCPGLMEISGSRWRCPECGAVKGTSELRKNTKGGSL